MSYVPPLLVSVVAAYGYAVAARPVLRFRGRAGAVLAPIAALVVLFAPVLIPPGRIMTRALVAVLCGDLFFKMIDYARQSRQPGSVGGLGDYLRFLMPFPVFLVVFGTRYRTLASPISRRFEVVRIVVAAGLIAICLYAVLSGLASVQSSFALDHALKLVIFVVTIESLSQALYGLERLGGYDTTPLMRFIILARTPSDFWRRYNTRVHSWLELNVFHPCGGRREPVRGVLTTFFVSGLFHELAFGLATSRFDGTQFAFFMIQAPAVLISPSLERFARRTGVAGSIVARGLTVLWMSATSVLFFHSLARVFPFVDTRGPLRP